MSQPLYTILVLSLFLFSVPSLAHGHHGGGHGHGGGHHSASHHSNGHHSSVHHSISNHSIKHHSFNYHSRHVYRSQRSSQYNHVHYRNCGHRINYSGHHTWNCCRPNCIFRMHTHFSTNAPGNYFMPLKGTHEFAAGGGSTTFNEYDDNYLGHATPNYFFSYCYYLTNRIAVGFTAATQTTWGADVNNNNIPYNYNLTTFTLAFDLKWLLLSHRDIQLYQGLSGGLAYYMENDRYQNTSIYSFAGTKPEGQVTLVGVRAGRSLGVFGELGFGYRGMACIGLSYEPGRWMTR